MEILASPAPYNVLGLISCAVALVVCLLALLRSFAPRRPFTESLRAAAPALVAGLGSAVYGAGFAIALSAPDLDPVLVAYVFRPGTALGFGVIAYLIYRLEEEREAALLAKYLQGRIQYVERVLVDLGVILHDYDDLPEAPGRDQ